MYLLSAVRSIRVFVEIKIKVGIIVDHVIGNKILWMSISTKIRVLITSAAVLFDRFRLELLNYSACVVT